MLIGCVGGRPDREAARTTKGARHAVLDMVWILDNVGEMVQQFATAASVDPVSAVLVAAGIALLLFSGGVFGVLALGGLVAPLGES